MAKKKSSDMVIKSNTLVSASYHLSLSEIRLLDIALAELSEYESEEKHVTTLPDFIEIRADEYAKLYNVTTQQAYTALREASEQLFTRYFRYEVQAEDYPSFTEERKARWVGEIGYVKDEGVVTLSFTKALVALAGRFKIGGKFTRYHVEQKAPLTSIYAHRLYEMMMSWRKTGDVPYIGYMELRQRFEIESTEYKRMSNFKSRVLEPALRQINDLTDIKVTYTQEKKGRKIIGFTFKFKFKETPKKSLKAINNHVIKPDNDSASKPQPQPQPQRKIPKMSDKQRNTFANKLLKNFDFIRDYNSQTVGKRREELLPWVEQGLADDDKRQEWRKYILMSGYEFPSNLKN